MTSYFDYSLESERARDLPPEFDAESRRIDDLIAQATARELDSAPSELSDRVFESSVALLPQPAAIPLRHRAAPAVHAGSFRLFSIHMHLGRVALAAMVLLAFGIGALMMHSAGVKSPDDRSVADRRDRDASRGGGMRGTAARVADWEIAAVALATAPGSVDEVNDKVGYLLVADDLTTPEDVRNDMAQLLASLE